MESHKEVSAFEYLGYECLKLIPGMAPSNSFKYFLFECPKAFGPDALPNPEKYVWKISIWNKASPPRRLTNDLVFSLPMDVAVTGQTINDDEIYTREGVVPKPLFALLLDDNFLVPNELGGELQIVDLVVCVVHRDSGVSLYQSHLSFSLISTDTETGTENSSTISNSQHEHVADNSSDAPKRTTQSLFSKLRKASAAELAERSQFDISDAVTGCQLRVNRTQYVNFALDPFQLETQSRRQAAAASGRDTISGHAPLYFSSRVSFIVTPFALPALRFQKETQVIHLQPPFRWRKPVEISPRCIYGQVQQSPYLFASVVDLQLTQDIIELHRHKKLLVTVSYICEGNRALLLSSSYLGCIFQQHGEWMTRSEMFCSDVVKSALISAITESKQRVRLGDATRPDLIRIDLFLLNPNESSPVDEIVCEADGTIKASTIHPSLHRVRLFSGRVEASFAFSAGNRVSSEASTAQALRSSFGQESGVTIFEYNLEIPLFVASPNKVKQPAEVVPRKAVASPPRSLISTSATSPIRDDPSLVSSNTPAPTSIGIAAVKKVMVGKAFLKLEVVQEACLGHWVDERSTAFTSDELLLESSSYSTSTNHGRASHFVVSVVKDLHRYPNSEHIYQSNSLFESVSSMSFSSTLEALGTCAAFLNLLQSVPTAQVDNASIEATGRLMRLAELFLFRLTDDKELVDQNRLHDIVERLEQLNVGALLWDYFQFWLTTALSKNLIVGEDRIVDIGGFELSDVDWRSVKAVCIAVRLLSQLFALRTSVGNPSNTAHAGNIEISFSLGKMAQELVEGIAAYGFKKISAIENTCLKAIGQAKDVFLHAVTPSDIDSVKVRTKLEVEYANIINSEIDEFMNAGGLSEEPDDSRRKKAAASWDTLLTVKLAASKLKRNQKLSKFVKAFEILAAELLGITEVMSPILQNSLTAISLLLESTMVPIPKSEVQDIQEDRAHSNIEIGSFGNQSTNSSGNVDGKIDLSFFVVIKSLFDKAISVYSLICINLVPPACAVNEVHASLGVKETAQVKTAACSSVTLALSLVSVLVTVNPRIFDSLDGVNKFLFPNTKVSRSYDSQDLPRPGEIITNCIVLLSRFTRDHLIHGWVQPIGPEDIDLVSPSLKLHFECSVRYLSISLSTLVSVVFEAIAAPLGKFCKIVPQISKPDHYLPPSSAKRKKQHVPLTSTAVREDPFDGRLSPTRLFNENNNSRGVSTPGSPLRSGASLSVIGNLGNPNLTTPSSFPVGSASTLTFLRSLQVEAEKPPEPVMAIVGGGRLGGVEAICYLGRKFEILQAIQYSIDVYINIQLSLADRTRSNEDANIMHLLRICRNFIHIRVMNAITKGNQGDKEHFTALVENITGDSSQSTAGRCFVQLLMFISCFATTWWSRLFDAADRSSRTAGPSFKDFDGESFFGIVSLDEFIQTLTADSFMLSQGAVAALYRINSDGGLDIDSCAEYIAYLGSISASEISLHGLHRKDRSNPASEWIKFRNSLLSAITMLVKCQLLTSEQLLRFLGLTSTSLVICEPTGHQSIGNISTTAVFASSPASIVRILSSVAAELPHCIALLQDLSSLEPLVDLRPDMVLMSLDFEFDQLEFMQSALSASSRRGVSQDNSSIVDTIAVPPQLTDLMSTELSYFLYPSSAERALQKKLNVGYAHQFDAIAVLRLLLELSSLVPVLSEAASKSLESTASSSDSINVRELLAPIAASRDTILHSCLHILRIFSPGDDSQDIETALKYQALESTFLLLMDRFVLGSLPLSDPTIMQQFPTLQNILVFDHTAIDKIRKNKFYTPDRCSTVVSSMVYVLCSRQAETHWFPRLDQIRNHFVRKLNSLHWLVAARLFEIDLEAKRKEFTDSFFPVASLRMPSNAEDGISSSSQKKLESLLATMSLAAKRKSGPSLRAEDKIGLRIIMGPKRVMKSGLDAIPKTIFFSLRKRYTTMIEAACLSTLIHEQGFGHGVFTRPIGVSSGSSNSEYNGIRKLSAEIIRRLNFVTRNRFWRSLSVRKLLNYLHSILLYRIDLKQKTDIRLIGSETSFNYLLAESLVGGNQLGKIEARRRLLDSFTGVACDPIEKLGFGSTGIVLAAKLALHFSICSLLADDRNLFANQYPSFYEADIEYKSHTNYELILEHGGQLARDVTKYFLRVGEWENSIDILTELHKFYQFSSAECVAEARLLAEDIGNLTDVQNEVGMLETEQHVTSSARRNMVEQLDELRRHQRHGYCLDHYRRNCALNQEMLRSKDKLKERNANDSTSRPHAQFYAIRLFPNPFAPQISTEPGVLPSASWPSKLIPFFECTGLPCQLTLPVTHRVLQTPEQNSSHDGYSVDDTPEHYKYLDAELFLDPVDSLGHDRALWMIIKADPTSFMASSELYASFTHNENRARERGDIKGNGDRLPVFLPPSCYHAVEAQLCSAFPEYRVVSPNIHLDIGSNVRNDHHHGRILDRTIQIFEAFPEVLCEDSTLANELMEQQQQTENDEQEYGDYHGRKLSVATKDFADEYVHEEEGDHTTRAKKIYEQAINSSRFYIFGYENRNHPFQSMLDERPLVSEENIDPNFVLQKFEDEFGSRLLRYTLVTSSFNIDATQLAEKDPNADFMDETELGTARDDDDSDDDFDDPASAGLPSRHNSNDSTTGAKFVFPGLHSLQTCAWLSPALFCTIESVRRMDPIKACNQVCNAQLISTHVVGNAIAQVASLSTSDFISQPAGDIVNGPSLLVAAISSLSNVSVAPTSCAVGLHAAKILIAAEIDRREKVFQNQRKQLKRKYMRELAEYENGTRYDAPDELNLVDLQREHENSEEAVHLITLQMLSGLLNRQAKAAVEALKSYYSAHISRKGPSRQLSSSSSQRSLLSPSPIVSQNSDKRLSSRFKSVERFGVKATSAAEQSVELSATLSTSIRLGESQEELEEEQLIWMELILWIDAHLSAHTTGFAL